MEQENIVRQSRKLSKILRHRPEIIGLELDENGWADVAELLEKIGTPPLPKESGSEISMEDLKTVVETNDKKRFAFNDDFSKIRANQGHSVKVDLALKTILPPSILFHGTATKNVQSIENKGLMKGSRNHVHLSVDEITAKKVGSRHGKPIVLKVKALEMYEAGFVFNVSDNGVWLTETVPVQFLIFP